MSTILVIDDSPSLLEDISTILKFEAYDVFSAPGGLMGLQLAHDHIPDLILCDIMMPDMDGYEVLSRVRQDEMLKNVPFVFVTAMAHEANRQHTLEALANGYLTKPFAAPDLLELIERILKNRR